MQRVLELAVGFLMIVVLLPVHECAHAFVANRLGDPTARLQGRLTLNPVKHIDPIGAILLLVVHFGWGRPVPVDVRYFKKPKRDMALVAVAGPVSNLLLAFVLLALYKVLFFTAMAGGGRFGGTTASVVLYIVQSLALTSIYLAVFNMLPVPPLDGSRLVEYLIPGGYYTRVARYQRVIHGVMLALLLFTDILTKPMSWLASQIYNAMNFATGFIDLIAALLL